MNPNALVASLALLLGSTLAAQQITVTRTGWSVNPQSQIVNNTFFFPGVGPNDFIMGGCVLTVGTSETNSFVYGNASWQGQSQSGPQIAGGGPQVSVARTETYTRTTGAGNVTTTLTAQGNPASFCFRQGSYRGVANATASARCPSFLVTASCQVRGVQPPAFPVLMTVPQTASVTLGGQNSWWVIMGASADCTGTISGTNSVLQMNAICDCSGTITLS